MSRFSRVGFLAVATIVAAGCASEAPPRSFVQPNIIKKKDLKGTFYYIQTVTDAPPTNGSMFIGESSSLMKIRFDIQENFLYARRAFEWVQGSEEPVEYPEDYKGETLAAWRISSQFDIIRDFNSTTGEQTNRVIESTERPWQQREFIRVDWSQNAVTDYVGLGLDLFFSDGQPEVQQVSYWVSDPTHRDALHIEYNRDAEHAEGFRKDELTYLDITNMMIVTPEKLTATYEENGKTQSFTYPRCFFYYQQDDCASQRIKIRHAFSKVPPVCGNVRQGESCKSSDDCAHGAVCDAGTCVAPEGRCHDYEPRKWDGKQMDLFGVWDVGLRRMTYDRDYGITNQGFIRRAARFNFWKHSYQPDGKTLIKPAQREIRTTPYYASGSRAVIHRDHELWPDGIDYVFPEELWPQFKEVIRQWDEAGKVAVEDAMGRKLGAGEHVYVACHNPVRIEPASDPDPEICQQGLEPDRDAAGNIIKDKNGNPILHARQGDPRRSHVFWVNQQQNAGPLGYGPPMYDPITGEIISGQAYIFGGAIDSYTARSRDLLLLTNGDITNEDFAAGMNVQEWIDKNRPKPESRQARTYTPQQIEAMAKSMNFDWALAFSPENGYSPVDTSSGRAILQSYRQRLSQMGKGYFAYHKTDRDARLRRIIGTPLERMMVTPDLLAANRVGPSKSWEQLTDSERLRVSPIRAAIVEKGLEKYRLGAERRGVDFAQFDDEGISNSLQYYLDKYSNDLVGNSEALKKDLRERIFLGVTLHEVGHNIGLRHNFRGSYDSMNYFDNYWKLRHEALDHWDGDPSKKGDGKLHPRYMDVPGGRTTRYEIQNGIREYQYSSIMDYGAEFNADLQGLGRYDKAFMKFSYAEFVEVFTDVKTNDPAVMQKISSLHAFQGALGFPSALGTGARLTAIPYQTYPTLFNSGWEGMSQRKDVPYSKIEEQQIDRSNTIFADPDGNPMVPYYFCSDEFAGNLTCQRFDAGADTFEQIEDVVSRYKNFYIVNNFKRDRQSFHSSLGYLSRIKGRYFEPMRYALTWYVLLRTVFEDFLRTNQSLGGDACDKSTFGECVSDFFWAEEGWGNFTIGVHRGFETIAQVLATPTAGLHLKTMAPDGKTPVWKQFNDDTSVFSDPEIRTVGLLDGKYLDTKWDYDACGYYWAEECQSRIGYLLDKTIALEVLTDSQAYFTGRDTNVDVREYAIGYYSIYDAQIAEKFGALFAGDVRSFAPYWEQDPLTRRFNLRMPQWAMADPKPTVQDPLFPKDPTKRLDPEFVDPQASFTLSLYAGVYGLSTFPTTFDHDFIDDTQIFVVGNGESSVSDKTILEEGTSDATKLAGNGGSKEWFVVTDAQSGKTFAAHSRPAKKTEIVEPRGGVLYAQTKDLRRDTGVRMLEQVQLMATNLEKARALPAADKTKPSKVAAAELELKKFRQNIEVMRSLHKAFGYGPYKTDAPFYY